MPHVSTEKRRLPRGRLGRRGSGCQPRAVGQAGRVGLRDVETGSRDRRCDGAPEVQVGGWKRPEAAVSSVGNPPPLGRPGAAESPASFGGASQGCWVGAPPQAGRGGEPFSAPWIGSPSPRWTLAVPEAIETPRPAPPRCPFWLLSPQPRACKVSSVIAPEGPRERERERRVREPQAGFVETPGRGGSRGSRSAGRSGRGWGSGHARGRGGGGGRSDSPAPRGASAPLSFRGPGGAVAWLSASLGPAKLRSRFCPGNCAQLL